MSPRRNGAALEAAVDRTTSASRKAVALYELGVFHDNNSRESEAIPIYEKALRAGLPSQLKAQALAWLASSLYKTGNPKRALTEIRRARAITKSGELRKFLEGLESRVNRSLARNS